MTFAAVQQYQGAKGIIPVSGFVGPLTRGKINIESCSSSVAPTPKPPVSVSSSGIYEEISVPNQDLNETGTPILYRYKISAPKENDVVIASDTIYILRTGVSFEPVTMKVFSDKKFKKLIQQRTVSGNVVTNVTESLNYSFNPKITIKAGKTIYFQVETTVGGTKDNAFITTSHKGLGSVTVRAESIDTTPSITVISPNGGESYIAGESLITIKYRSSNISGQKITAYLYHPEDGDVRDISGYATDSGELQMNLGKGDSIDKIGSYKITICAPGVETSNGKDLCDSSNNYFTLTGQEVSVPSIKVLSPNGGENYYAGESTISIKYNSENITGEKLTAYLYSPSLGDVRSMYSYAQNSGTIDMMLAKGDSVDVEGQYKINICAENVEGSNGKTLCDISNNYFTLINR